MGQDIAALTGWGLAMLSAASRPISRRDGQSGGRARPPARRGRAGGPRQADAAPAAGTGVLRPLGRTARRRKHRQERRRHRADCGRNAGGRRLQYGAIVCSSRSSIPAAPGRSRSLDGLEADGHPTATIDWHEPPALGAEFVRWEIATAIAGALLGINPFDEPNVKQAKDATTTLLDAYQSKGALPRDDAGPDARRRHHAHGEPRGPRAARPGAGPDALLTLLQPGDYFALLAYVGPRRAGRRARPVPQRRSRPHACRDDVRRRPAVSALDRPAAQGRSEHRRVPADHGGTARGSRYSWLPVHLRHARTGAGARRLRLARRGRPAGAARPSAGGRRRADAPGCRRPARGGSPYNKRMRYLVTARVKANRAKRPRRRPSTTARSAGGRLPATNTSAT